MDKQIPVWRSESLFSIAWFMAYFAQLSGFIRFGPTSIAHRQSHTCKAEILINTLTNKIKCALKGKRRRKNNGHNNTKHT